MRKAFPIVLLITFIVSWSNPNSELNGEAMKKFELSKSDETNIKTICKEYIDKLLSNEDQKILKTYYAKELWATGGENLLVNVIESYALKKIHIREIKEIGNVIEVVISFHVIAETEKNSYESINKNWSEQMWFINEDGTWKIKSIFSSVYFSKEGALKWAQRFKNSKNDEYAKVAELILNNLK